MSVREIIKKGDPCLEKKCHRVSSFDEKLWTLLDDMHETLEKAAGAGLAAPQIGILRQVVLVVNDEGEMMELINPEIIEQKDEQRDLEGCLSLPGYWGFVTRPNFVTVKAQDRFGKEFTVSGEEMTARCLCHEIDHLKGILYDQHAENLLTAEEIEAMYSQQEDQQKN